MDAFISRDNVSPTMFGVVGTSCMVHANERNNFQVGGRVKKRCILVQ